jgi:hypothetical protein
VRRFTLITIIVLLVALLAVAVYQITLGTSVEERLDREGSAPVASY